MAPLKMISTYDTGSLGFASPQRKLDLFSKTMLIVNQRLRIRYPYFYTIFPDCMREASKYYAISPWGVRL